MRREQREFNDAVRDLERSIELNDQRFLYRSRFLLDEDRAVRGASLAGLYRDAGLPEVGLHEAVRAVSASDRAQQSRLPGAIRSDHSHDLALGDLEGHLAHRLEQPVPAVELVDGEQRQAPLPR